MFRAWIYRYACDRDDIFTAVGFGYEFLIHEKRNKSHIVILLCLWLSVRPKLSISVSYITFIGTQCPERQVFHFFHLFFFFVCMRFRQPNNLNISYVQHFGSPFRGPNINKWVVKMTESNIDGFQTCGWLIMHSISWKYKYTKKSFLFFTFSVAFCCNHFYYFIGLLFSMPQNWLFWIILLNCFISEPFIINQNDSLFQNLSFVIDQGKNRSKH